MIRSLHGNRVVHVPAGDAEEFADFVTGITNTSGNLSGSVLLNILRVIVPLPDLMFAYESDSRLC